MVIVGIDAHKRSHTAVAVDETDRKLGQHTTGTTSDDHLALLSWAEQFGDGRLWAIEDCRHLSRRLERDLLGAGERTVRVPTKLMAHARDAARSHGSPMRSMRSPSRGRRCASPICPPRSSTGRPARSACLATTATISSLKEPA
jgi:transposase